MSEHRRDVTQVLHRAAAGDAGASENLWALIYDELRVIARRQLRNERADHTLSPTALVHETYLRLVDQTRVEWSDRSHFFAVAARMCRRVLVDHARRRKAARRGGGRADTRLDTGLAERVSSSDESTPEDLIALDDALEALGALSPRLVSVVEMRYFGGLTEDEIAEALGVTSRTVRRDWVKAKGLLLDTLRSQGPRTGEDGGGAA